MIGDTNLVDLEIALITAGLTFAGVVYQSRKARKRSSEEHAAGTAAVLAAIEMVHDEVKDVKQDLRDHIEQDHQPLRAVRKRGVGA